MPVGKFTKAPAAAAQGKAAAAPKAGKGDSLFKFKGIESQQPREPLLNRGEYLLRFESASLSDTDWFRATFEVVEYKGQDGDEPGDRRVFLQPTGGKSFRVAKPILKRLFMAIAGYETDEEYDAFDEDDEFAGACMGEANSMAERGITGAGRLLRARVTYGKEVLSEEGTPTGDFYRNVAWAVVPDEEQDQ